MKIFSTIIAIIFVIMIHSCTNTSGPENSDNFFLKISVKNSAGSGVSGLKVSAWNNLIFSWFPKPYNVTDPLNPPTTSIPFELPVKCLASLKIWDLNNNLQVVLLDTIIQGGYYTYQWNGTDSNQQVIPSGVYKCKLTTKDIINSSMLYLDSIYIVLWKAPDVVVEYLGYTNQSGIYETNNALLFPSLFHLPPIPHTSSSGPDILDYIKFSSSITITITDTALHQHQTYTEIISGGFNQFNLTWNPSQKTNIVKDKPYTYLNINNLQTTKPPPDPIPLKFSELKFQDHNGSSQTLYFGLYDSNIDPNQYELPPPPPAGTFDVRFTSQRMLVMAGPQSISQFPITLSGITYPLTISWIVKNIGVLEATLINGVNTHTMLSTGHVVITTTTTSMTLKLNPNPLPSAFGLGQNYPNPFN